MKQKNNRHLKVNNSLCFKSLQLVSVVESDRPGFTTKHSLPKVIFLQWLFVQGGDQSKVVPPGGCLGTSTL